MWIAKRILVADRVRHPPRDGFSWIDRRFVREFASGLGPEAMHLYFFLAAVADKSGLSYYKDETLARRLDLEPMALARAREELIHHDLIAWQSPLYQVLTLPVRPVLCPEPRLIGTLFEHLVKGGSACK